MAPLQKRIVVITGASGGLGQVLCQTFASQGDAIAVHVHQNRSCGRKLVKRFQAEGRESELFSANLKDSKSVRQMFDKILDRWKRIDILINNAGVTDNHLLIQTGEAAWDTVIGVNLTGAFFCLREAGRLMQKNGGGHIINIASISAYTGPIGQASYAASKRGLIALTQSAALEWAPIQVNAVLPGFLPSGMTSPLSHSQREKIVQENLLKQPSTLQEVSHFIFHLSTMKQVSGQIFNLDSRIF